MRLPQNPQRQVHLCMSGSCFTGETETQGKYTPEGQTRSRTSSSGEEKSRGCTVVAGHDDASTGGGALAVCGLRANPDEKAMKNK